jgi:putative sterol carrier protein
MNLEAAAAKIREKLAGSGFDRSIKLDLEGAGAILIDGASVSVGDGEADCTISMSADDFEDLLSGDLNPTSAFMTGKMKIDGDMSAAMALSQLI